MANRPLHRCGAPGCRALTASRYCAKHAKTTRQVSAQWHKLYNLAVWKNILRPKQLTRCPWCAVCAQQGKRVKATVVDHIIPHKGNMALFANENNLQSLCKQCHDAKTMRELQENLAKIKGK